MANDEHPLFRCPNCGGTDWKADYYESVWQTIALLDVGGEPLLEAYMGVTGTYQDGDTGAEAFVCRECGYKIGFGRFVLVPTQAENVKALEGFLAELREACEYDPEGDSPVDDLIDYKNALEDALGRIVAERGLPASETAS